MSDSLKDAPVHTTTPCNECKHHLGDWVCAAFPPTYKGQVLTVDSSVIKCGGVRKPGGQGRHSRYGSEVDITLRTIHACFLFQSRIVFLKKVLFMVGWLLRLTPFIPTPGFSFILSHPPALWGKEGLAPLFAGYSPLRGINNRNRYNRETGVNHEKRPDG